MERIIQVLEALAEEEQHVHTAMGAILKYHTSLLIELKTGQELTKADMSELKLLVESLKHPTGDQVNGVLESLRKSGAWKQDTKQEREDVQAMGMKFAVYFVSACPLLMVLLTAADHWINVFVFHTYVPLEFDPALLWVCTASLFAMVAFGWKMPSFSIFDLLWIFKPKALGNAPKEVQHAVMQTESEIKKVTEKAVEVEKSV